MQASYLVEFKVLKDFESKTSIPNGRRIHLSESFSFQVSAYNVLAIDSASL